MWKNIPIKRFRTFAQRETSNILYKRWHQKKDASNSPLDVTVFHEKFQALSIPAPSYSGFEIIVAGKFIVEEEDFVSEDVQQLKSQSLWALENAVNQGLWYCRSFDADGKLKHYLLIPDNKIQDGEFQSYFNLTAAQLTKKRTE